jgi:hypothetical protein
LRLLSLRNVCCVALLAASAVACGGAVFGSRDDSGNGGSSSAGGSSQGGASSTAGKPSKGGSNSTAGASAMGGRLGTGGTNSVAGTTSTAGQPTCDLLPCAFPACPDGQMPITPAGECCPSCPPPATGCDNVQCQPVKQCGEGEELQQPAGACCAACMPKPGNVACLEIACPQDKECPLGYVSGDKVGGCCYQCLPDPLFCNEEKECVMADRPRSCCGCPEVISRRAYDADACWSDVADPRMIPQSCYPQVVCDALCAACPPPLEATCIDHRCTGTGLK